MLSRVRGGAVSQENVYAFFDNFVKLSKDLPPENMFNYDETCFRDENRLSKCLSRKRDKYVETVMNIEHLQADNLHMFCGSSAGQMMPPMVVYKAEHTMHGPKDTAFSSSESG
jgi:hypothetical protein